jgi:hypothetical protein
LKKTLTIGFAVLALSLGSVAAVAAATHSNAVVEATVSELSEIGTANQGGDQAQSGELGQQGQSGEQAQSGELGQQGQGGEQGLSGEGNDAATAAPKK